MTWERRDPNTGEVRGGLTAEDIRQGLWLGEFGPEDWIRRDDQAEWKQVATVDEFAGNVSGSRRRRLRPVEEDDGMDMTPMIDCTFLLLIFFMITASFHLQKGLDFPPDKTETKDSSPDRLPGLEDFGDRILLNIGQSDEFTFEAGNQPPVPPADLVETLKRISRDSKKTRVLIVAHELASHEAVVLAIDSCGQAGLRDVSLADTVSRPLGGQGPATIKRN